MADIGESASRARPVWLGVMSLCLVQFVDVLGVTVMVTALPAMLADLRASADAASLISTGYAMFFGGLPTPLSATGAVIFGLRSADQTVASWPTADDSEAVARESNHPRPRP
jgi:hypothetical protein